MTIWLQPSAASGVNRGGGNSSRTGTAGYFRYFYAGHVAKQSPDRGSAPIWKAKSTIPGQTLRLSLQICINTAETKTKDRFANGLFLIQLPLLSINVR